MKKHFFSLILTIVGSHFAFGNLPLVGWDVASSNTFQTDTRPASGASDSSSSLANFVLDTVDGLNVGEFYIEGPESIASGETGTYQMYLRNPSTGEVLNISSQARLRLAGGRHPNVGIGGRTVFAYDVATATNVTVYATYRRTDGQVASEPFTITLATANLDLSASGSKTDLGNGSFQIDLSADASGGSGDYTYTWNLDGDGNYDDAVGASASATRSETGTHIFRVRVEDSNSTSAEAIANVTINKPLAPGQPEREIDAFEYDPPVNVSSVATEGGLRVILYDHNIIPVGHSDSDFSLEKADNGLIIIVHGMTEKNGGTGWWPAQLARSMRDKLTPDPNILVLDWTVYATPSETTVSPEFEFIENIRQIREVAKNVGEALSGWILENSGGDGAVNPSKNIHLVGHSAGGFVVGETALRLLENDIVVDRVTFLDTPVAYKRYFTDLPDPVYVERVISSIFGSIHSRPEVNHINTHGEDYGNSKFYSKYFTPSYTGDDENYKKHDGHNWSYGWYHATVPVEDIDWGGFYDSPFRNGPSATKEVSSESSLLSFHEMAVYTSEVSDPWASYQSYGEVTGTGLERTLTEGSDVGLFQNMTLPVGASELVFDCQFEEISDGDFLAVTFENKLLQVVANTEAFVGKTRKVTVSLQKIAGKTGQITFNLVSRGEPNAVLKLANLEIIENDDLDGDGILNADELSIGTDPGFWDTDGDRIPDGDELPESDPLLADTDGDGSNDLEERIAGTDPRDPNSVFKVSQFQAGTSSYALWWKSIPGKTYRVIWSETPDFAEFEVIASDLTAGGYETSYIDYAKPASHPDKGFYRLEVVEE